LKISFEGKTYEVPDDLSQEEIAQVLGTKSAEGFPKVTEEEQAERDRIASQLRLKEVGGDRGKAEKVVRDFKQQLKVKGLNGSVRKMLRRELDLWEGALETMPPAIAPAPHPEALKNIDGSFSANPRPPAKIPMTKVPPRG
jgi:hypothetical protein